MRASTKKSAVKHAQAFSLPCNPSPSPTPCFFLLPAPFTHPMCALEHDHLFPPASSRNS